MLEGLRELRKAATLVVTVCYIEKTQVKAATEKADGQVWETRSEPPAASPSAVRPGNEVWHPCRKLNQDLSLGVQGLYWGQSHRQGALAWGTLILGLHQRPN